MSIEQPSGNETLETAAAKRQAEVGKVIEKLKEGTEASGEVDVYAKWKKSKQEEISAKGQAAAGKIESVSVGTGGEKKIYDSTIAGLALEDYGEMKFFEEAQSPDEVKSALVMINKQNNQYKDRSDLKADLYIKEGSPESIKMAENLILNNKDGALDMQIARSLDTLFEKNPALKDDMIKKLEATNPDLVKEYQYQMKHKKVEATVEKTTGQLGGAESGKESEEIPKLSILNSDILNKIASLEEIGSDGEKNEANLKTFLSDEAKNGSSDRSLNFQVNRLKKILEKKGKIKDYEFTDTAFYGRGGFNRYKANEKGEIFIQRTADTTTKGTEKQATAFEKRAKELGIEIRDMRS